MKCPACHCDDSKVVDSRTTGSAIRRRRQCAGCGFRFTTHERVELRMPWVLKKGGRREPWQRDKVRKGLALACRKRPIDEADIDALVSTIEQRLVANQEIASERVGETVMEVLRGLDAVAYVRFASVYGAFESVEQFADAIRQTVPES
jgi:transcriptional repressor NrdR